MEQNGIPKDLPMEQVMAFAKSPAGQQLMQMLQRNNTADLNKAVQLASSGNTAQARDALSSLMADPKIQALLKQFGG